MFIKSFFINFSLLSRLSHRHAVSVGARLASVDPFSTSFLLPNQVISEVSSNSETVIYACMTSDFSAKLKIVFFERVGENYKFCTLSVLYWRALVPTMSGSFCSMCASTRALSYIWIFHAFSRVQITLSGAFSGKSSVRSVLYSQEFRTTNNLENTHIKCVHMNLHTLLLNAQLAICALSSS